MTEKAINIGILKGACENALGIPCNRDCEFCEYSAEPFKVSMKAILLYSKDMPTVDTERHGHWIVRTDYGNGCREIVCSECGETGFWRNQPLYCPHCGAKMDGVTE